jgi:amino acid adenylation domain-containing protein
MSTHGGIAEVEATAGTEEAFQGFGLSPQQRRLWWLARSAPDAAFAVQVVVRIAGELDASRLLAALGAAVQRHEILRTNFRCAPGRTVPLQVIREELPPAFREATLQDLAADLETPLDLEQGSPVRAALVVLDPRDHLLALTLPALCCDRAGALDLAREIASTYAGSHPGEPAAQYADLAEWQNALLRAPETRAGWEYWNGQDAATWAAGALPCELRSDARSGFSTLSTLRKLPAATTARLAELGFSPDLALLAGWRLLLGRWGGGDAVAVTANGRRYEELEGVIGIFSRALPVVVALGEEVTLRQATEGLAEAVREAFKFQESFDWEQLRGGDGEAAGRSFLPWAFDCEEAPAGMTAGGARFTVEALHDRAERWKLRLSCIRRADGVSLEVHWDPARFDGADAERLAAQLPAFLERLAGAPDTPAAGISLLSDGERAEVVSALALAPGLDAGDLLVHQLFERQAAETPEAPALICDGRRMTYRQLSRESDLLARRLRSLGVGPEARVAICAERSPETDVGLLAVLKAGGAYVPIEPGQPRTRTATMLEEVAPPVVLAPERLRGSVPEGPWRVVGLGDSGDREGPGGPETGPAGVAGANLAYVLFTSGSTGRPKGVAVEHRQILAYLQAVRRRLDFPPGASFAMVSTFAADLGLTMLYPALCGGGCLHVLSQEQARDPGAFAEYASRHAIDCLKVVPSHLDALLEGPWAGRALPRRRLVLGGEAARPGLLARLRELAPECEVFNHYGPTETTVGVMVHPFTGSWDGRWGTLPLGLPLDDARVFLLDGEMRPVPFWLPGEVYVGGAAVTRGYLGQPALTAERFVPDPWSGEPGGRMYRTGDLVRLLPSGDLEFLGRIDDQVKIRGFRVELREIEAVLAESPEVAEAVVVAREDTPGDRRLAAYLVAGEAEGDLEIAGLRNHLKGRLPDYMIPASFTLLDRLPLTSSGKVDRRALPAPDRARRGQERNFVAPRTHSEETIAAIWREVLGLDRVGVTESFFELGGHSLLLPQVIHRLRAAFQVEVPLRVLFEEPTIEGLAVTVEEILLAEIERQLGEETVVE